MTMEISKSAHTHRIADPVAVQSWWPFITVAGAVLAALMLSSTPTPLYALFQASWHFSSLAVTEIYAVYAIGVLLSLIVFGGLSDAIGRRPVIGAALVGLIVSTLLFMLADSVGWLYAGRAVQGLTTGLLLGASSAALIDLHPTRDGQQAGVLNGIVNATGLGAGAGLSGVLVQWAPHPTITPFLVMGVVVFAALVAVSIVVPEPVVRGAGRVSLRPRAPKVPRALWRVFTVAGLGVLAAWSVGGLYLSLGPALVGTLAQDSSPWVGGAFVCMLCAFGALIQWPIRHADTRVPLVGGASLLAIGTIVSAVAVLQASLWWFVASTAVVGLGFGGAFTGALRMLSGSMAPEHRAQVMSAFFVVAYASISIPAIAAGVAVDHAPLDTVAEWFASAVAAVAIVVAIVGWRELTRIPEPVPAVEAAAERVPVAH